MTATAAKQAVDPDTLVRRIVIRHRYVQAAISQLEKCFANAGPGKDPRLLAIIGDSGAGKSKVLSAFQSRHRPQRSADGLYVPVILIRAPPRPTAKNIAELLLHQLGDPFFANGSESVKTIRLKKLLRACGTRLIIIDEFNHLVDRSGRRVWEHVADYIKVLAEEANVGVVVAGLPRCTQVIECNPQLKRRFLAPIEIPSLDWSVRSQREEFQNILQTFQSKITQFSFPSLADEDFAFRIFLATAGLIGRVANLLIGAMSNAQENQRRTVLTEDFLNAFPDVAFGIQAEQENPFNRAFMLPPSEK